MLFKDATSRSILTRQNYSRLGPCSPLNFFIEIFTSNETPATGFAAKILAKKGTEAPRASIKRSKTVKRLQFLVNSLSIFVNASVTFGSVRALYATYEE
jgi:hypothetical protein